MGFEYDSEKSAENKRKHGVDFEEAQALWSDPALLEIPARVSDEQRWVVVGKMNEKHWSAVITRRGEKCTLDFCATHAGRGSGDYESPGTFDRKFDVGEKTTDELDLAKARRIGTDPKRVNVDFLVGWWTPWIGRHAEWASPGSH